jgi:hypothetical protein
MGTLSSSRCAMHVPGTRHRKPRDLEAGDLWSGGVVSHPVPTWGGRSAPILLDGRPCRGAWPSREGRGGGQPLGTRLDLPRCLKPVEEIDDLAEVLVDEGGIPPATRDSGAARTRTVRGGVFVADPWHPACALERGAVSAHSSYRGACPCPTGASVEALASPGVAAEAARWPPTLPRWAPGPGMRIARCGLTAVMARAVAGARREPLVSRQRVLVDGGSGRGAHGAQEGGAVESSAGYSAR